MVKTFWTVLLVAAALGLPPAAFARQDTTEPTQLNDVLVILKDKGLSLSQAKFDRGNEARFLVRNAGKNSYRFKAGLFKTKLLKRGQHAIMIVFLGTRGRFAVEQWSATGRVARVFIKVV
ncbi:MAG: hypothetical protein ABI717_02835 [Actinomycetota bacterium]